MKTKKEIDDKIEDVRLRLALNQIDKTGKGVPTGLSQKEYNITLISMLEMLKWVCNK